MVLMFENSDEIFIQDVDIINCLMIKTFKKSIVIIHYVVVSFNFCLLITIISWVLKDIFHCFALEYI